MERRHYLAFDLGAESGRAIIGTLENGKLVLDEVHRFVNPTGKLQGRMVWNVLAQWEHLKQGLKNARRVPLTGIGVDTWGVDFGLLDASGQLLGDPMMYRDPCTGPAFEAALAKVPRADIYAATGIQFMAINSLYQLLALKAAGDVKLKAAAKLLFMPDLFNYLFSGVAKAEATIASTSQMYDPREKTWATGLLEKLDVRADLLPPVVPPGTVLGKLLPEVADECGVETADGKHGPDVIAVGGHDTASAVAAVPAERANDWCYVSSGTWSLLGVEQPEPNLTDLARQYDFTNEAGVAGTVRLLKNIAGLWLVQECRRQFALDGYEHSYVELTQMAARSKPFQALIDPVAPPFSQPGHMPGKITQFCHATGQRPPLTRGDIVRCCLDSLAFKYRQTLLQLEHLVGRKLTKIHIVGGGGQNGLLNQLTADVCQRDVYAGPTEATAIGNIVVQAIATGAIATLADGRKLVRDSFPIKHFKPEPVAKLDELEKRFLALQKSQ